MTRQTGVSVESNFTHGLITEATGLNFPENAVVDADNCIFTRIGNVTRRLGIDYEENFEAPEIDPTDAAISEFLWKNAALSGELVFLVLQVGNNIIFYRLDNSDTLSANRQAFTVSLTSYQIAGSPLVNSVACSFAAGNGVLFVVHPYCDPFYVSYDQAANSISTAAIHIKIRDMRGLDQSAVTASYNIRPSTSIVTDTIRYNLLNQGWAQGCSLVVGNVLDKYNQGQIADNSSRGFVPAADAAKQSGSAPALDRWFTASQGYHYDIYAADYTTQTSYPSEADVWWTFKYPDTEAFDPSNIQAFPTPINAPAAKGHFIFDAFNLDRASIAMEEYSRNGGGLFGGLSLAVESSGYFRPSQVAFFSGRAFYAGVAAPGFSTKIYFTRVTEQPVDYGKCHQQLDPASEDGGDLVASDGGVIVIPDMAQVVKLFAAGANLFVFCTNGIWRISGSLGQTGFAANQYAISRVSVINAVAPHSFVDVDGLPVWWNNDGIWALTSDQLGTTVKVDSISLSTIASFIDEIPTTNKRFVKGAYNPFARTVQWIYRSEEPTTIAERYQYDKILVYDLLTKAFYPWSLSTEAVTRIVGIFVPQGTVLHDNEVNVVNNAGDVVVI